MSATHLLLGERARQVTLGYNRTHDTQHTLGEISRAALARLLVADYKGRRIGLCDCDLLVRLISPWNNGISLFNQERRRLLIEAGALILAELDRLQPPYVPDERPSTAVFCGIGDFARSIGHADRIADPAQRLKVFELLGDFADHLRDQAKAGIEEATAAVAATSKPQPTAEEI